MNQTTDSALVLLCTKMVWRMDDLPDWIGAQELRELDDLAYLEASFVTASKRELDLEGSMVRMPMPQSGWFSPIRSKHELDWRRIRAARFDAAEWGSAPTVNIRIVSWSGNNADLTQGYSISCEQIEPRAYAVRATETGRARAGRYNAMHAAMGAPPPELGEWDRKAFQLYLIGHTQKQIAEMLNKESSTRVWSQPRVSEALGRVRAHPMASELEAQVRPPATSGKMRTLDPARIELGARTDHKGHAERSRMRQKAQDEED